MPFSFLSTSSHGGWFLREGSKIKGFSDGLVVEELPAMQETQERWVRPLGRENPLEEEVATHSSVLAWRIPWMEEPGVL